MDDAEHPASCNIGVGSYKKPFIYKEEKFGCIFISFEETDEWNRMNLMMKLTRFFFFFCNFDDVEMMHAEVYD